MKKISNYSIRITIGLVITIVLILNLGQGITKGIQIIEKNERDLSLSSLTPHDPIWITSDNGLEVFPGTGTAEHPYLIEGYNITTTDDYGIFIYNTTKYFIIRNCYVEAGKHGISIYEIADGTAAIINNMCNNNIMGIKLRDSVSSTVANNTCNNNDYHGIWLDDSVSSTVANNTCNNNDWHGIWLEDSDSSTVANNTCSNNNKYGIQLWYSDFCVITYNLLLENVEYGIYLEISYPRNNLIHHNTFVDNNLGGSSQARDEGSNNFWYDTETLEGNYWSDWSGTGSYSIDGSASSEHTMTEHTSVESTTDENPLNFTFALLLLVVPLMLTRIISKKVKKE